MNYLVNLDKNLIQEMDKKSVADIIKPLRKSITLRDYHVRDINELCPDILANLKE